MIWILWKIEIIIIKFNNLMITYDIEKQNSQSILSLKKNY